MKNKNVIVGFHSGHDCSYCILEDGIPIIHEEYERITRIKEGVGDGLKFFVDRNPDLFYNVSNFTHCYHYPSVRELGDKTLFDEMIEISKKNQGGYYEIDHHKSHAAHAYYSSKFDKSLIITIDAGGWDRISDKPIVCSVTIWKGEGNKLFPIQLYPANILTIGGIWHDVLNPIFGLSSGPPKGNQAGTIMAMAAAGNTPAYLDQFYECFFNPTKLIEYLSNMKEYYSLKEENKYNLALGLQLATERIIKELIDQYYNEEYENICFSGGTALNSVAIGKVYNWFGGKVKNIFVPLVPYDGGLSIGAAQYIYHHIQNNPKIKFEDYYSPYLGITYTEKNILSDIEKYSDKIIQQKADDNLVTDLLRNGNIISIFNGKSESGRRALGNRSILADPTNPKMKDFINDKVKHRQWFRPFAPSILDEEVENWFVKKVDSPYMGVVVSFREEVKEKVPAVVHLDGTGRLQTVTSKINSWYYNFLKLWFEKTKVPILLNTSFNDREPIVETPEDSIKCFLRTNIDYLYFPEIQILVSKK